MSKRPRHISRLRFLLVLLCYLFFTPYAPSQFESDLLNQPYLARANQNKKPTPKSVPADSTTASDNASSNDNEVTDNETSNSNNGMVEAKKKNPPDATEVQSKIEADQSTNENADKDNEIDTEPHEATIEIKIKPTVKPVPKSTAIVPLKGPAKPSVAVPLKGPAKPTVVVPPKEPAKPIVTAPQKGLVKATVMGSQKEPANVKPGPQDAKVDADKAPKEKTTVGKLSEPATTETHAQKTPPRTVLDLQNNKIILQKEVINKDGKKQLLEIINLNPQINSWFVVTKKEIDGQSLLTYHVELTNPQSQILVFTSKKNDDMVAIHENHHLTLCPIYSEEVAARVSESVGAKDSYTLICEDKLFIRNYTPGRQSPKEALSGFLRKYVWGGDEITNFIKTKFFKDGGLLTGKSKRETDSDDSALPQSPDFPPRAEINSELTDLGLESADFELPIINKQKAMRAGRWYVSQTNPNIFVSVVRPTFLEPDLFGSYSKFVAALDPVEKKALTFLVAFRMSAFDINYSLGTDHPSVEWSPRTLDEVHDKSIPGPDGFDSYAPLIGTGRVNPLSTQMVAATFVGGFKRDHGAFKWGKLATINSGSHYGFMEQGVIFSSLNPGLATIYIDKTGQIGMKTWTREDNSTLLPMLKHARQNGVPIIDGVDEKGISIPGALVRNWSDGNWSGSVESKQRGLRAALCLISNPQNTFLIYTYFSSATANAMARVMQAYHCHYAVHLDMNALEHTYFATYAWHKGRFDIKHLIKGMKVLDVQFDKKVVPRFLGMSDNRDFFYLSNKVNP